MRLIMLVVLTAFLFGCSANSTTVELYPIKGPLSESAPQTVLYATVNGVFGNSGTVAMNTPEGETCRGRWSSAAAQEVSFSTVNLFSQYGYIYGTGTSVRNKPGVNRGEAIVVCPSGNRFDVEFYTGSGTANGYGLAKDRNHNIYKALF